MRSWIIGVKLDVEVLVSEGRIDAVMHGPECIFVAEFKMGTAEEARNITDSQVVAC